MFEAAGDVAALEFAAVLAEVGGERDAEAVGFVARFAGRALWNTGGDFVWQVTRSDLVAFRHNDGAVDRVLQFAYVAGPVVLDQTLQRSLTQRSLRQFITLRGHAQELVRQQRDVFATIAQRRNIHRNNSQAIEEISAEVSVRN